MSNLYLIDAHTTPIADSDLQEVRFNATNAPLLGNFVVRVPNDIPIASDPSNLSALLTAKYAATLAFFSTFGNIVYEDFTDTPGVNMSLSPGAHVGIRCTTKISPRIGGSGGVLRTNTVVLGGAPTIVAVTWELYSVVTSNPSGGRLVRQFSEISPAGVTTEISFDNGATWTTVTDRAIQSIALPSQGTNMVLRFTNTSAVETRWFGSWAVLF